MFFGITDSIMTSVFDLIFCKLIKIPSVYSQPYGFSLIETEFHSIKRSLQIYSSFHPLISIPPLPIACNGVYFLFWTEVLLLTDKLNDF